MLGRQRARGREGSAPVGRQQDGRAPAPAANDVPGEAARDGVHAARWLVQDHHFRLAHKRQRHAELAPLAAREYPGRHAQLVGQADLACRRCCQRAALARGHTPDSCCQLQVVGHCHGWPEDVKLRAHAQAGADGAHVRAHRQPSHQRVACRWAQQASQDGECRGLARAVLAQQRGDAPGEDGQRQAVNSHLVRAVGGAEGHGERAHVDCQWRGATDRSRAVAAPVAAPPRLVPKGGQQREPGRPSLRALGGHDLQGVEGEASLVTEEAARVAAPRPSQLQQRNEGQQRRGRKGSCTRHARQPAAAVRTSAPPSSTLSRYASSSAYSTTSAASTMRTVAAEKLPSSTTLCHSEA